MAWTHLGHTAPEPPGDSGAGAGVREGDRRIALALFRAQTTGDALSWIPARAPNSKTFAEIAALVRRQGWTQAFRELKVQGLIGEQTLGHVVARWGRPARRSEAISPSPRGEIRAVRSPVPS